jgi:hypothetical protein
MIRISSKKEGFRRCGVAHGRRPVEYPDDHFSADELVILRAESMLEVEDIGDAPARLNASDTIALIKAATTVEALDGLQSGEERISVLAAIAVRRKALEPAE